MACAQLVDGPRPSLTVIVAAFNAEGTIRYALDSVRAQAYDNWLVVVVDDGSTDATGAIAQSYVDADSRFSLIRQENAGAGAARNRAIASASSDFVLYLDADDLLAVEHMREMVRLVADYPGYDIYSSDGLFAYADGSTAPVFGYDGIVSLTVEDMLPSCMILGGGALVRTRVIRDLGGFREHMYGEDYDLWLRALARGYKHIATPQPLYIYHQFLDGQKSEDSSAGYNSAVVALTDLIDSGLLNQEQVELAHDAIANYTLAPRMEAQKQALARLLRRVVGPRLEGPIMRAIRRFSWVVRPLRKRIARIRVR